MFVILPKGMLGFYFLTKDIFFLVQGWGFGLFVSYVGRQKVDGLVLGEMYLTTETLRESNDKRTLTG